jgi:hypothetical protein
MAPINVLSQDATCATHASSSSYSQKKKDQKEQGVCQKEKNVPKVRPVAALKI